MTTEQTTELPGWLHPDDDEMPPERLRALYGRLPLDVTQMCERARKAMRDEYVCGIVAVRDALAAYGMFKEWCAAAGINYRTATTILQRHDAQQRQQEQELEREQEREQEDPPADEREQEQEDPPADEDEGPPDDPGEDQAGDTSTSNRPPAKKHQLVVQFVDDVEWAISVNRLRDVLAAVGVEQDEWGRAVCLLLDFWEEHHAATGTGAAA